MKTVAKVLYYAFAIVLAVGMIIFVAVGPVDTGKNMLNGKITFTTQNATARVTGTIVGTDREVVLSGLEFTETSSPSKSKLNSWSNSLLFDSEGSDIVVSINIENFSLEKDLVVTLFDNIETTKNVIKTISLDGEEYTEEKPVRIAKGTDESTNSISFRIVFSVEDTEAEVSGVYYNFNLKLVGNDGSGSDEPIPPYNPDDPDDPQNPFEDFVESNATGLTFSYDDLKFEAIVTGVMSTNSINSQLSIPSNVINNNKFYKVVAIGDSALSNNSKIRSLTLPESLKTIGARAFSGCVNLQSVKISRSVTSIGERAFAYCGLNLKTVYLLCDQATIGDYAFESDSITSVYISSYESWCRNTFSNSYSNPLRNYGSGSLYLNGATEPLTEFIVPDSITQIKKYAFISCTSITKVTIPQSVTEIGIGAFYGCSNLERVDIFDIGAWCGITFGITGEFNPYAGTYPPYSNPTWNRGDLWISGQKITNLVIPNTVTTIKAYAFYNCDAITSVDINSSVESIGAYAFNDCGGLTNVNISNLQSWCNIAFSNYQANPIYCAKKLSLNGSEITELSIPNNVTEIKNYAFYNFKGMTTLNLGNNMATIGEYTFYGCSGLTAVTIPTTLRTSKSYAFAECGTSFRVNISSLENWCQISFANHQSNPLYCGHNLYLNNTLQNTLELPSITTVKAYSFTGCGFTTLIIPSSVTKIEQYAFANCKNYQIFNFINSIATIDGGAFDNCTALTRVNITDINKWSQTTFGDASANPLKYAKSLYLNDVLTTNLSALTETSIKKYAFTGWNATNVTIPDSVTTVGQYAFNNASLQTITIGAGVTKFEVGAFSGCSSLKRVNISDMAKWCATTFESGGTSSSVTSNPLFNGASLYLNNSAVQTLTIPTGVTSIKSYAFNGCASIRSATIPSGVTSVGDGAFSGCANLSSVNIQNSNLTTLSSYLFYNCKALSNFTVRSGITAIYSYAFSGCSNLTSISIPTTLSTISSSAFSNCSNLKSVYITDLNKWLQITFNDNYSNPLCNGSKLFLNNSQVTSLTIPNEITSIRQYAFCGCTSITSVIIPSNVTTIYGGAFASCTNLTTVQIGSGVTRIDTYHGATFSSCSKLVNVYIDSATIARGLASSFDYGNLVYNITHTSGALYINRTISNLGSYVTSNFTAQAGTTTYNGNTYIKYVRN